MEQLKALIVDDNLADQFLIDLVLKQTFLTTIVSSIREAEQAIEREKYDLMTLDINLPGKTGIDFLATIGINNINRPKKIYIVSSVNLPLELEEAIEGHCDQYVPKDDNYQSLRSAIESNFK